jgi:hypothetical protein
VPTVFGTRSTSNQLRSSDRKPRIRVDKERVGVVLTVVLAEARFQRRAAGAEQVIYGGEAGRVIGSPLDEVVLGR